jgi:hypothetical protein
LKKLAFVGAAGALGAAVLLQASLTRAADHLDSPAAASNPMADLADVYAWMTSDASQVNLAMTVSPADDGSRHFGPTVQYVFHVAEHAQYGAAGTESKIICTFADDTSGQCWVVSADGVVVDYVNGDLSGPHGRASQSGRFRVFAGRRSDPFFFNLAGFKTAITTVEDANPPALATGCPDVTLAPGTPAAIRSILQSPPTADVGPCVADQADCFASFNVLAIVVQVDKDELVSSPNKLLSVWASTHMAQ